MSASEETGVEQRGAADEGDGRPLDFQHQIRERRLAKLDALRQRGVEPYPVRFDRDCTAAELHGQYRDLAPGVDTGRAARLAGRLLAQRRHGGLDFGDLHDETGVIQLMISRDHVGDQAMRDFSELDLGDWIGVSGTVATSEHGELSIRMDSFELLSKSLRALPSVHDGITDPEARYRQRYLDLTLNESTRRTFAIRSTVIASTRRALTERGFTEVETPVLLGQAGGAAARPFITHHNALDIDMTLRIALELPLKRLIVGGMDRVFEIGRVFRNEGLDTRHNPEFTLLEAYQAFGDYHDMMELTEAIVATSAMEAIGTTVVSIAGREVDLKPPWRRVTMAELIRENVGVEMHPSMPVEEARKIAEQLGIEWLKSWGSGKLMNEVYDESSEHKLIEPTFVIDHPREVSPLARAHRDDPALTERFELVVAGRELANAYSELNDPVDQAARFQAEARLKAGGDDETEPVDEDYVEALEYGLPPTGGLGIGMDRLVMLIAGEDAIRDVILFPTLRPERHGDADSAAAVASDGAPTAAGFGAAAAGGATTMGGAGIPGGVGAAAGVAAAAGVGAAGDVGAAAGAAGDVGAAAGAAGDVGAGDGVAAEDALAAPMTRASTRRSRALRPLAWASVIVAILSVLPTATQLRFSLDTFSFVSRSTRSIGLTVSVVIGLGLIAVARGLSRGKRRAWTIAVALFAAAAVVNLLHGPDPLAVLLSVAMLIALIWFRREFRAQSDRGSLVEAAVFVPLYLLGVLVFTAITLFAARHHITPGLSFTGVARTAYGGLVGIAGPYTYHQRVFRDFMNTSLVVIGIVGVIFFLYLILRTFVQSTPPTPERRRLAERIVRAWGDDTLDCFALRRDKNYYFSDDGRSLIAYLYVRGTAMVAGDPVGPPEDTARTVDEFLAFCASRGWRVAFFAVREADAPIYRARGMHAIYLGDEAILRCRHFSLNDPGMKAVRSAVRRIDRDHHYELIAETDASKALIAELNEISAEWRAGAPERGFTMELGLDVEGVEPDFVIGLAREDSGRVAGFLRFVPVYGDHPGYSLDLMRRRPDAANGITEYLIASSALALGARGFERLSLNFAAWGRLLDSAGNAGLGGRLQRMMARGLNPFFQIQSLRDFNQKFNPEWVSRSVVIDDVSDLPRIALLYASVEGFLDVPLLGRALEPPIRQHVESTL
jgi:lysyl-tRNA synthetase class 2